MANEQLRAINVNDFVDPGRISAKEALSDGPEQRLIRRGDRVLSCFVNVKDCTTRFQDTKFIALDGKQRTRNDALVGDLYCEAFGSKQIGTVPIQGCDDLACNCHLVPLLAEADD